MAEKMAFSDSFWGDKDEGLNVLIGRMKSAKHTTGDLATLVQARAVIEDEYGKKLIKLAKTVAAKDETGTLRAAMDTMRSEMETTGLNHVKLSTDLRATVEKPIMDFMAQQREARKPVEENALKSLKNKQAHIAAVVKAKEKYDGKCKEADQLVAMRGKDGDKTEQKLKKAKQASEQADREYLVTIEKLQRAHAKWIEDMRETCEVFQRLEEERIERLRSDMWNYANVLSTICVSDDESCERIRKVLENCHAVDDMNVFVRSKMTGSEIPRALEYVNYYGNSSPSGGGGGGLPERSGTPLSPINPQYGRVQESTPPTYSDSPNSANPWGDQNSVDNTTSSGPGSVPFNVKILYNYTGESGEELSLRENEIIKVVSITEDPWWEGENSDGKRGIFPSNFCERM